MPCSRRVVISPGHRNSVQTLSFFPFPFLTLPPQSCSKHWHVNWLAQIPLQMSHPQRCSRSHEGYGYTEAPSQLICWFCHYELSESWCGETTEVEPPGIYPRCMFVRSMHISRSKDRRNSSLSFP